MDIVVLSVRKELKRGRRREQLPGFCLSHKGHAGDTPCLEGRADRPQRRLETSLLLEMLLRAEAGPAPGLQQ